LKKKFIFNSVIITAVFLLIGCGGGGGGSESAPVTPPPTPTPSISTQGSLDFGVAVIGSSSSRQFSIANVGSGTLNIGQLSMANANSSFSIADDNCSSKSLPPSGTCTLTISLTATEQINYSDTLTIPSNDNTKNPLSVALVGKGRELNVKINEVKTDGCGTKLLKLLVSVTTSAGVPVTGLPSDRFTVFENGILKPINTFTHPITTPISVDLVLDYSGSLSPTAQAAIQSAAQSFVANLANASDEVGVIKFALTIGAKLNFTTDRNAINAALDAPYPGDTGGTILYDSLMVAIDDTFLRTNDRKAVIVFSDGNDEGSSSNPLTAVIERANLKGIPIFTIAYTDAANPKPEIMQQIAQETGGEFFLAPSSSELAGIYDKISEILSQQYLIEYTTSSSGGTTVSLDIEVINGGDLGEDSKEATGC
jgi:Ca-activated chloride channel homolog